MPNDTTLQGCGVLEQSRRDALDSVDTLSRQEEYSEIAHLFLLPASNNPSTVELIVPSAPSVTFSHVRVTSQPVVARAFCAAFFRVLGPALRFT